MANGMAFFALFLLIFIGLAKGQQSTTKVVNDAASSAAKLARFYTTVREIALPPPSVDATGDEPVQQRLVMLLPGKVLSYYDYFPGDRYEASLEDPHHDGTQVPIPPRVMENMFALADVVPGVHPLRGAETGESMAIIYDNILNQLEVRGFNEKTQSEKERYVVAIDYLSKEIADPLNVTQNVTRFQLYRRSQDLYNQKRLDMENTIDEQRQSLPAIEYEHWFQRNYPALNSEVEGAYTEWLIFGQKEIVELYKSYLDVESPGIDLEDARIALRASGLAALDRTRTIFPVSFVPSNWYRYLTNVTAVDEANADRVNGKVKLSRDEIQAQIGVLTAKKKVLQALREATGESSDLMSSLESLREDLDSSNTNLTNYATTTESLRRRCLRSRIAAKVAQSSAPTPECIQYEEATSGADDNIFGNSELFACFEDLDFQINSVNETKAALSAAITSINNEIDDLQGDLLTAATKFPELARHAADTQDQLDSRWLQFNFNSSNTQFSSESSQKHYSVSAAFKASGGFWSVSGSFSHSQSEQKFSSAMNSADLKISGELLRVTVQRPWFRPSLFKSKQFQIRAHSDTDPELKVSPGPLSEIEFVSKTIPGSGYLLPQYVTGLLLARNVEMDFYGVDASYTSHAVRVASSARLSGGFGFFRASASYSSGRSDRQVQSEQSSSGLRISIPGAQVIGYFTQVLPLFPN